MINHKGKTYEETYGIEIAKRLCEMRRIQMTNSKQSDLSKQRISATLKEKYKLGKIKCWMTGKKKEKCCNYKGGKIKNYGYVYVLMPEHPHANSRGYLPEHHLIMEQDIGRYLVPKEMVHHLDFDSANNDINNLHLFTNKSEHIKYHEFLKKIVCEALK